MVVACGGHFRGLSHSMFDVECSMFDVPGRTPPFFWPSTTILAGGPSVLWWRPVEAIFAVSHIRCWMFDVGCSMFDVRCSMFPVFLALNHHSGRRTVCI